ncbi:methyltransferase domain-containing protein [Enhygromyxa salina]|uniref:methyltransferase domain-containing protein n=1 Tax=Enhygromyxa salina TaxID=215803 RepID=UPI0015E7BAF9|nr:methyltransferase domain-containing protein [Enhygromyxa salina]
MAIAIGSLALVASGCDKVEPPTKPAPGTDADTTDKDATADKGAKPRSKSKRAKPTGPKHTCNVCGTTAVFKTTSRRKDATCPVCKCSERHRLFIHYLAHGSTLLHEKLDVLHFSPNECEETALRHQPNWHYVTTDFMHEEDLSLDLTNADQPDDSWDLMILYHLLEHIPDDKKAMSEMYRILRPGGRAILQVPLEIGLAETYEDPTITDPKERRKHFGQSDHVRKYSIQGLRERLEAVGFEVEALDYLGQLDPAVVERHQFSGAFDPPLDEAIWIVTKPGGGGGDPLPEGHVDSD